MIFSQKYLRALNDGRLQVEISDAARPKLSKHLSQFNASYEVQRDPNDNLLSHSSIEEEAVRLLMIEHGWDSVPSTDAIEKEEYSRAFHHIIRELEASIVFDLIELAMSFMEPNPREQCRKKVNEILDLHDCPWTIADGEFFKLDSDFLGIRLAAEAHDVLAANRFAGAANEYAKARQELALHDVKDAIIQAGKSFESTMQIMTGMKHSNADGLIRTMLKQGYFDDLPETIRQGFAEQVMKTLPFLRNKLAGHGQGAQIIEVPHAYGVMAVQLAAVFHNFLVTKYIESNPPVSHQGKETQKPNSSWLDDDIPF